jgi:WD40 repeat protein
MSEPYDLFCLGFQGIERYDGQSFKLRQFIKKDINIDVIALTSDSANLICTSYNKIFVYDTDSGEELKVLEGHTKRVTCVTISSDNKTIVSGSFDGDVMSWNLSTGELKHIFQGHKDSVKSVAISPNGVKIASGSDDNTVCIWSSASGKLLFKLEPHPHPVSSVIFTPDNDHFIFGSQSYDKTIQIWKVGGWGNWDVWHHVRSIDVDGGAASLAISPSGYEVICGSYDGYIRVYNIETKEQIRKMYGHTSRVVRVVITPDKQHLVSVSSNGTCITWILGSGGRVETKTQFSRSNDIICSPSPLFCNWGTELRISGVIVETCFCGIIYKVNLQTRVVPKDNVLLLYEEEILVKQLKLSDPASALQYASWILVVKHNLSLPIEQRAKTRTQIMNRYTEDWLKKHHEARV